DDQRRRKRPPIGQKQLRQRAGATPAGDLGGRHHLEQAFGALEQGGAAGLIGHHMGKGLARRHLAIELQQQRPRQIAGARIGNAHGGYGLGLRRHFLPDAESLEETTYAGGDGGGSIVARHAERPPIDQRQPDAGRRTGQRQR